MWYVEEARRSGGYGKTLLEDTKLYASYSGMREIASQVAGTTHAET